VNIQPPILLVFDCLTIIKAFLNGKVIGYNIEKWRKQVDGGKERNYFEV